MIKCSASKEKAQIMCDAWERKSDRSRETVCEKGRDREVGKWEQNKVTKHSGVHLVTQIVGGTVLQYACFAKQPFLIAY